MLSSASISANSVPVLVAQATKREGATNYAASVYIQGTFDSATVTLYASYDNGKTLCVIKNSALTTLTATANAMLYVQLGGGDTSTPQAWPEQIWAQAAGGGGSLAVTVTANSNA